MTTKPSEHFLLTSAFASYTGKPPSDDYEAVDLPITNELGLYAIAYRQKRGNNYILSFRGTESSSIREALKDWSNNANSGWPQYEKSREQIIAFIRKVLSNNPNTRIHLVGHSLGGALAQFTAYDVVSSLGEDKDRRITLTTWNALGGEWGLSENVGQYNPNLLAGIEGTHFFRFDDLVARLGGNHVGGAKMMLFDRAGRMEFFLTAHSKEELEESLLHGTRLERKPRYFYASPSSRKLLGGLLAGFVNATEPEIEGDGSAEYMEGLKGFLLNSFGIELIGELKLALYIHMAEIQVHQLKRTAETINKAFDTLLDRIKGNPELEKKVAEQAVELALELVEATEKQPPEEADRYRKWAAEFLEETGARMEADSSPYGKTLRDISKKLSNSGRSLSLLLGEFIAIPGELMELAKLGITAFIERIKKKFAETEEDMKRPTPLVLDLDGDGIETLGLDYCVYFDHDGNGFAEHTGWIGADDALLILDRNGNGLIDTGAELFGDHTPISLGGNAHNGFEALADLDTNQDGKISVTDPIWARLAIWQDTNSNAIAEKGECISLQEAKIQAIPLTHTIDSWTDVNGNIHQERGSYILNDGSRADMTDVWFANDRSNTLDLGWLPVSPEIAMLPEIHAGGNLPSLHQAMQRDPNGELVRMVRQWFETPEHLRDALIRPLMYTWAGVRDLPDPILRDLFDLRSLRVLEMLLGNAFMNGVRLPAIASTPILTGIFDSIARSVGGLLNTYDSFPTFLSLVRMQWESTEQRVTWNFEAAIEWLREPESKRMSSNYLRDLRYAIESLGDSGDDLLAALRSRIHGSDQARDLPLRWLVDDDLLLGSPGNDVLRPEHTSGTAIAAGSGDDAVYALHANDLIDGGEGNDQLHGGAGNDTYLFRASFGKDTVIEEWNSAQSYDTVVFSDYASTDIASVKSRNGDLLLTFRQGDELSVTRYVSDAYRAQRIDLLRFADGVNWNSKDLQPLAARNQASSNDDILGAVINATSQTTFLDGLAGNDLLLGSGKNDQLLGNLGNDALHGGAGDDWLSGGPGTDWLAGGPGRDHYLYRAGDGLDTIEAKDDAAIEERDTIQFEAGICPIDVLVRSHSDSADLILTIRSATNQIHIKDFLVGRTPFQARNPIEAVQFADGTRWDTWQLTQQAMQGSEGSDWIKGTILSDRITGRGGTNRLEGMAGDDLIQGGDGFDEILGGEGNDTLSGGLGLNHYITQRGHGEDIILAELVAPAAQRTGTLLFSDSTRPEDLLFHRSGMDLKIGIRGGDAGVTVQQFFRDNTPANAWNPLTTIEFMSSWDVLSTTDILAKVANHSLGTVAEDWLRATGPSRYLHGLAGDDTLHSGEGDDLLDGGTGIDTASYAEAQQAVSVDLSLGTAQDTGGAGHDTLVAIENLRGSRFADSLSGSSASNHLDGGEGDDLLWGSLGADQHTGGPGADRFVYRSAAEVGNRVWGRDWILDFSDEDRLDLSRIDADLAQPGDQAFVWIGDASFSAPGQLRYSLVDGNGLLKGNLEGTSDPEFTVGIRGGFSLDPAVHLLL